MQARRVNIVLSSGLEPELTQYLLGNIYPAPPDEMLPNWTLNQVRKSRKLILTFLYVLLLTCPAASAYPNGRPSTKVDVYNSQKKITVKTSCPPLTAAQLRQRMGPLFDETRMSSDDPGVKRTSGRVMEDRGLEAYLNDEEDIDGVAGSEQLDEIDSVRAQSRKFMRRKREAERDLSESDNSNRVSDDGFLYMNMAFSTIERRKSRQRRGAGSNFHPAWECTLSQKWVDMEPGYFPTKILKGSCKQQKSCFFGLYRCNPVKYSIKVLKRDTDDACKPVPLVGLNTTYEESWSFMSIHVTVACECGTWKSAKRKRGRNGRRNRD